MVRVSRRKKRQLWSRRITALPQLEIILAFKPVQGKQEKKTKKIKLVEPDVKVAKKREDIRDRYSIEVYHVQMPHSFYKSADYDQLYAHMGNARLPKSQFLFSSEEKNPVIVEEYKGEMTGLEAESVVQRIVYMQLFGTTDGISIDERERFMNWRHFNHEKRRLYEATMSVRYKPLMGMKPMLAK